VFAEPQFPAALVRTVIRGTGARLATLDPLGAGQTRGPGLYGELMRKLANDIAFCQKERSG
jgi:zinc transport system substrate-binding protein